MNKYLQALPIQLSLGILGLNLIASSSANAQLIKQEFNGNFNLVDGFPSLVDTLPDTVNYSGFMLYHEDGNLQDFAINIDELGINYTYDSVLDTFNSVGNQLNQYYNSCSSAYESDKVMLDSSTSGNGFQWDSTIDLTSVDFTSGVIIGKAPKLPFCPISFSFSSELNWSLSIDPLGPLWYDRATFDLKRDDSQLTFFGSLGLAGYYNYQDSSANINPGSLVESNSIDIASTSVPEPSTLLGIGVIALATGLTYQSDKTKNK